MATYESSKRRNRVKDITGWQSGMITVIAFVGIRHGAAAWQCWCSCGRDFIASGKNLRKGYYVSCGCHKAALTSQRNTKHAMHGTAEYRCWRNIRQRCFNPKNGRYDDYGGRGITMCEEWRDSFASFYAHVGPRPDGCTLDRINNDGNYEPGNVRWATAEQQRHNKRTRRWQRKPSIKQAL